MGHLSLYRFSAFWDREASNDYATSDLPYTFDGSYFVMAQLYFPKIFFLEYKRLFEIILEFVITYFG